MSMLVKNGRDVSIATLADNPELYIVPENEKHLYHVIIEIKKFNADNGKRQSIPRIQKAGVKNFTTILRAEWIKQGYTITMLHDPAKYSAEQKALSEQKARQAAADALARKEADDELKKAQEEKAQKEVVDNAVADALAKQKKEYDERFSKLERALSKQTGKAEKVKESETPSTGDAKQ